MNMRNRSSASAGVAVAALGLSFGLGAAATAGSDATTDRSAPALSAAEKKVVKKLAVRIAKREITRAAPTLSVGSAKTAESATRAATAGRADLATRATSADLATRAISADLATTAQNAANAAKVGGLDVRKINTVVPANGAPARLVDAGGFSITATCAAGVVDLRAASTEPGGRLRFAAIDNNDDVYTNGDSNLGAAGTPLTVPGGSSLGSVTLEFVSASGQVVNVWLAHRDDSVGCVYFGNYLMG